MLAQFSPEGKLIKPVSVSELPPCILQVPQIITEGSDDRQWIYKNYGFKLDQIRCPTFSYVPEGQRHGMSLDAKMLEKNFSKKNRPSPISKIITQGRWECGPAALAMLLDESLREVKQACVHSGWNNDDHGINDNQIIQASALLGHIVKSTLEYKDINQPCLLTVRSVNFDGMFHALCWNGFEILDPNFENIKRNSYGPDWEPKTVGAKNRKFILI